MVVVCLATSAALLTIMYRRGRGTSVLFYVGAFFALFAYGPVLNHLLGSPIYFGIDVRYVDEASVGFALAIAGLAAADLLKRQATTSPGKAAADSDRLYQFYPPLLVLLVLYGVVVIGRVLPNVLTGNKLEQIALAGPGHRIYLVIELCAVSTYFITRRSALLRRLWLINTVVYVAYCLVTSERDFLFVLFSVLLHRQILRRHGGVSAKLVLTGVGATLAASFLFATRAGQSLDITGVLNQGSLLFVDSFVLGQIPGKMDHTYGATYLQALLTLPPSWIYDSGTPGLSSWLVSRYAPGSDGGYGFSLSAEAYMNFGLVGVFGVFLLVGLGLRAAINGFGQSEWRSYFSVYLMAGTLYALRGDSSQLLKLIVYGSIFFAVIHVTSARGRPDLSARRVPHRVHRRGTGPAVGSSST